MKTTLLISAAIVMSLNIVSCKNNSSKTGEAHSSSHDTSASVQPQSSEMQKAMDDMMKDMHHIKMTGNVDLDFALMMKSHHEGAVDMAEKELASGQDEKIKKMAQAIADAQKTEIKELDDFIDAHKNPEKNYDLAKKDEGFARVMDKSMLMMMDLPKMEADASTDKQFVDLMIPHHQSAVYMAEGLLKHGKDAKLISMAKKMIADQQREVNEFKQWQETPKK